MGMVTDDIDRSLREALFYHEMFEPGQHGQMGFGLDHLMQLEETWAFTSKQIQDAMTKLLHEELVEIDNGFWHSTEAGRIARERAWQKNGHRHPTLTSPKASTKDLILALIRSGGEDYEELAQPTLEERQLGVYLPDVSNDAKKVVLQEFETEGLIRRSMSFPSRDEPQVTLTAKGLRIYAQQVVSRLGLTPPATILAAVEVEVLPFNELGLPTALADNLRYRWEEAERCMGARAWLSANILFGSILEVVLPEWLARFSNQVLPRFCYLECHSGVSVGR